MSADISPLFPVIRIAAALISDNEGRVLLVRKKGTAAFMQPGGKIEDGESPRDAVLREVTEELGCRATVHGKEIGTFSAAAANEPNHLVEAVLFGVTLNGPVCLGAEIVEALWLDWTVASDHVLAPLTRDHVLPLARTLR